MYLNGGMGQLIDISEGDITTSFEAGFLIGNKPHFFDLGIGYTPLEANNLEEGLYALRLGYRRQGKTGFFYKVAPLIIYNNTVDYNFPTIWFALGLGYSFEL